MNKQAYVLQAIRDNKHLLRGWLIAMLGILPADTMMADYYLKTDKDSLYSIDTDGITKLEGYTHGTPYLDKNEQITLLKGDLPMVHTDVLTTYGILIINALCIEYPYEGIVPYINGVITPGILNKVAYNALKSGTVTVDAHIRFENSISALASLSQTVVPSASRRSITPNPLVPKRKAELLAQHASKLHDPAVIANIQTELVNLDKEYLKGDSSTGFFIKKKSMNMARLRTMAMYGAEPDFHDESKISVIENSLTEGWGIDDMATLTNSARGGSYSRSASTALGGAEVKTTARVFQNYTISQDDCQTPNGLEVNFNQDNYLNFIGRYVLNTEVPLTELTCKELLGKPVYLRSPAFCLTDGTSICKYCIGDTVTDSEVGINALATTVTSAFLSMFMSLVHTSELSLHKYSYKDRIS